MTNKPYDLVVVGGGINGAGIAADAAGRGLRVLLVEANDLAGATSSASSKLIHGGLRYLEQYAFRLVREALAEREVLLAKAPHIIWPLRFVLPHAPGMRPVPLLRAGLFLYDHLSPRRTLGASASLDLRQNAAGEPLAADFYRGFAYWDCWVDDARLVVLNAIAARDKGAEVLTRTQVTGIEVAGDVWRVTFGSNATAKTVTARAVVNAAGPWVTEVARLALGNRNQPPPKVRMVKGSHIVVPRIIGADDAYIFQNTDGRVVFALPFEQNFTLIGTTDTAYSGDPRACRVTAGDEAYLIGVANRYFRTPLTSANVVWQFAGVRPLEDDGSDNPSAVSRDYHLDLETTGGPPILHVVGGKITTYRRLAEAALDLLKPHLTMGPSRTAGCALPGGDVGDAGYTTWFDALAARRAGFERRDLQRLARRYGTRIEALLGDSHSPADLGADLGAHLSVREVEFLKREEWATTADDVIWRRTKTALHVPREMRTALADRVQRVLDAI
ncbi:MAG: glycerol-3-phosphate dehydrogenase [Hyphomicrobium sp.]